MKGINCRTCDFNAVKWLQIYILFMTGKSVATQKCFNWLDFEVFCRFGAFYAWELIKINSCGGRQLLSGETFPEWGNWI